MKSANMDISMSFEAFRDAFAYDYKDEGIALASDARPLLIHSRPFSLDDAVLLLFVRKGTMRAAIDGAEYEMAPQDVLFCRQGHVVSIGEVSEDFVGHMAVISMRFAQKILAVAGNIWKYIAQLDSNPVIRMPRRTSRTMHLYYQLLHTEAQNTHNQYYQEVVSSIVRAMLCSLISDVRQSRFASESGSDGSGAADGASSQTLALFNRFMDILNNEQCTERKIEYYASRLCVTPKYLSTVCKRLSKRTAHQWIADAVVNGINGYLRYSDKSVKEIAVMYGFPNLSFFSKYVKKHLGQPPTRGRRGR